MQLTEYEYHLFALDIVEKAPIKKADKERLNKLINERLYRLTEYSYEN
tara:strand:+ start:313 stop:456 length:144 start_codon:yes stop_codon:yes gene_type:complete